MFFYDALNRPGKTPILGRQWIENASGRLGLTPLADSQWWGWFCGTPVVTQLVMTGYRNEWSGTRDRSDSDGTDLAVDHSADTDWPLWTTALGDWDCASWRGVAEMGPSDPRIQSESQVLDYRVEHQRYLVLEQSSIKAVWYKKNPGRKDSGSDLLFAAFRLAECQQESDYVDFVSRFGPLGFSRPVTESGKVFRSQIFPELLGDYALESEFLQGSLEHWEKLSQIDEIGGRDEAAKWAQNGGAQDYADKEEAWLRHKIIEPLKSYLRTSERPTIGYEFDHQAKRVEFPLSLRIAIWIQIDREVEAGTKVGRCSFCNKWFSARGRQNSGCMRRCSKLCKDREFEATNRERRKQIRDAKKGVTR